MRSRWLLAIAFSAALVGLPAAPASAHTVGGVGATNFHTALTSVEPAISGVTLVVVENGSSLEVRDSTPASVIVRGYQNEPYARVGPDGAYVNENSPATYLNANRFGVVKVPARAGPSKPPDWRKVSDRAVFRWHDHRTHWMQTALPPAVTTAPREFHQISRWTVSLDYGGRTITGNGVLQWIPGPAPWGSLVLLLMLFLAPAALVLVGRGYLALAAGVLSVVAADSAHSVAVALLAFSPSAQPADFFVPLVPQFLVWSFGLFAAWLLIRRREGGAWAAAIVGVSATAASGVPDLPELWRSSAPTPLPIGLDRIAVVVALGVGLGLVLGLLTLLNHARPRATAVAGPPQSPPVPEPPPAPSPAVPPATEDDASTVPLAARRAAARAAARNAARAGRPTSGTPAPAAQPSTDARADPTTHPSADAPPKPSVDARTGPAAGASAKARGEPAAQVTAEPTIGPSTRVNAEPAAGVAEVGLDVGAGKDAGRGGFPRRELVGYAVVGGLGGLAGAGLTAAALVGSEPPPPPATAAPGTPLGSVGTRTIPFYGTRQAGIATPVQRQAHARIAAFDLLPGTDKTGLRQLLRRWTSAAEALTAGRAAGGAADSMTLGTGPAGLTITVGFGAGLFGPGGLPRSARPAALAPLPEFPGDRLDPARSDGDLGVLVAADDPVVVFHALRTLQGLATGLARPRWQHVGFTRSRGAADHEDSTVRNLMGQIDGTRNPKPTDADFTQTVFVEDPSAPAWLRGGSYLVVRRIRMLLDAWERLSLAEQEQVIGRRKDTGGPLSGGTEATPANYGRKGADGSPLIPENAHIRLANAAFNQGAAILRRGYSYTDGAEAGLIFLAWQADPRRAFIPIQRHLVTGDRLREFIRHEASALFAMPAGVREGGYFGQELLE